MSEVYKNDVVKKETRSESRNHIFNIIFQGSFHNPEEIDDAIKTYYSVLEDELTIEELHGESFNRPRIDKDFIENEVKGIIENEAEIDEIISRYCVKWTMDRIAKVDLAILRLAIYEIKFVQDIPNGVSINEAVELAKKYSSPKSPAFINGVLGNLVKEI